MLDHVVKHMATKDDLEKIENKVDGFKVKVDGIQNTLDREAVVRAYQKLLQESKSISTASRLVGEVEGRRIHELEEKVLDYSKHPKHLPL